MGPKTRQATRLGKSTAKDDETEEKKFSLFEEVSLLIINFSYCTLVM